MRVATAAALCAALRFTAAAAPPPAASCAAIGCGAYKKGLPCQCNTACARHGDCCADYNATCGGVSPPPGPPHPHPPPAPGPPPAPSGPGCTGPEQFHLSRTRDASQMVVSFATCDAWQGTPSCDVGTDPARRSEWAHFPGVTTTYTDGGWRGQLHTVLLTGLATDGTTQYSYQCNNATTYAFTASPPEGALPLTFGVVADLGSDCARDGCGNATVAALAREAAGGRFSALIHAGDIAYTSGHQGVWDEFLREIEPAAARVPYQVCAGNHEHYYNFSGYLHRFAMPGDGTEGDSLPTPVNNLYHSYDIGGVHFVAFSTEHDLASQVGFLRDDLAKASSADRRAVVPWIVVYGHKPMYCSTNDYYDCSVGGPEKIRPFIEPLLVEYGVDLFLAGHLHNYERSWPIAANGSVAAKSYDGAAAPVHLVVGMAGDNEGLTDNWVNPSPDWSAFHAAKLGYGMMRFVSASQMDFEYVLSETGEIFDSFTLTKTR